MKGEKIELTRPGLPVESCLESPFLSNNRFYCLIYPFYDLISNDKVRSERLIGRPTPSPENLILEFVLLNHEINPIPNIINP